MPETLPDLVARLRATTPALADVPDDILTAEVARQLQARDGPSVGEAIGLPTFRTSNEKDAGGAAVVRAPESAWTKAATIGAPGLGDRYPLASVGEMLASENPLKLLAEYVTGPGRPRSVANADPLGITAFHEGKAPPPMFMGTTEEVGNVLGAAVGDVLGAGEGRGLYSRVDDAVSRLPAKGAHPNKIASLLKSNGATAEELAYRQVPEFLASQGNAPVTPGALQAHLDAHPAPLPAIVTHGGEFDIDRELEILHKYGYDVTSEGDFTDEPYLISKKTGNPIEHNADGSFVGQPDKRVPRAVMQAFERIQEQDVSTQTKFSQYQLPGGEQYKETLLTLPPTGKDVHGFPRDTPTPGWGDIGTRPTDRSDLFQSAHFDEPNILVHTRSNTRTLPTGERGRFLEEVQSDWHQAGKDKGYQGGDLAALRADAAQLREQFGNGYGPGVRDARGNIDPVRHQELRAQLRAQDATLQQAERAVPDAPFKETWPDLGLKQQLLEAAKDPDAQWLGFTSGQTQAARYDLSKQIARLQFDPDLQRLHAWDHQGNVVVNTAATAAQLPEYIGKEAANKLLATEVTGATVQGAPSLVHELEGQDLQVGGEGMHHFYDELLPKRLQKIVKPFGGTVERSAISGGIGENVHDTRALGEAFFDAAQPGSLINGKLPVGSSRRLFSRDELGEAFLSGRLNAFDMPNYLQDAVQQAGGVKEPAWIVRLTPAMKARILKEGLPLSLLLGAAAGPSVAEALGGQERD